MALAEKIMKQGIEMWHDVLTITYWMFFTIRYNIKGVYMSWLRAMPILRLFPIAICTCQFKHSHTHTHIHIVCSSAAYCWVWIMNLRLENNAILVLCSEKEVLGKERKMAVIEGPRARVAYPNNNLSVCNCLNWNAQKCIKNHIPPQKNAWWSCIFECSDQECSERNFVVTPTVGVCNQWIWVRPLWFLALQLCCTKL